MKISKLFLAAGLLMAGLSSHAEEGPLWMRYTAISPDGKTIAFSYKGDVYTVAATGGKARQLTTNAAYDACPVLMAPSWLSRRVARVAWMFM